MVSGLSLTRDYHNQGVLFPLPALDEELVASCLASLTELQTFLGQPQPYLDWTHLFFPWSYSLVTRPQVLDAVEEILGPDLLVQGSLFLSKPAHHPGFMSWHQDGIHSNYGAAGATTAWIALTHSCPENGCMRVAVGSHDRLYPYRTVTDKNNLAKNATEVQVTFEPSQLCDLVLAPGEMSLHHPLTVHGSGPNQSDRERIGFIIRFGTPQTQINDPVLPVRGAGDYGHLKVARPPVPQDLESAVDDWQTFLATRELQPTQSV